MTWRRAGLLFCAALAGALLPLVSPLQTAQDLFLPLDAAGAILRQLSLSGMEGNLLAWSLVLLTASLPLLLLVLPRGRGIWHWEDLLLPAGSVLILILAFFVVNPTYVDVPFAVEMWLLALLMVTAADLVVWGVLRLLRTMEGSPLKTLSQVLGVLLTACAVLLVFSSVYQGGETVLPRLSEGETEGLWEEFFRSGSSFPQVTSAAQSLALALELAELVPDLLGAWVLLLGADLAAALARGPFTGESAAQCEAAARRCRLAIQITLVLTLAVSLVKLTLFGRVEMVQVSLNFPLIPLILAAALYLLCRCLQRGRELQEDNDSII